MIVYLSFFLWTQRHRMLNIQVLWLTMWTIIMPYLSLLQKSAPKNTYKMVQHYWCITIFCCTRTYTQSKVTIHDTQKGLDFTQNYTVLWAKSQFPRTSRVSVCLALELSYEHLLSVKSRGLSHLCSIFVTFSCNSP